MVKQQRVPVSRRALAQRINRKLAADGRRLLANRGAKAIETLGEYCVVSGRAGHYYVFDSNFDLEALGRKTGALSEWEVLSE